MTSSDIITLKVTIAIMIITHSHEISPERGGPLTVMSFQHIPKGYPEKELAKYSKYKLMVPYIERKKAYHHQGLIFIEKGASLHVQSGLIYYS